MGRPGGHEHVALRTVIRRLAEPLLKGGVERNGVQRHLDIGLGRELRANPAHAFAGRSFALMRLALDDENIAASAFRQVPRDACAYDSTAYDDYVCCFHGASTVSIVIS